MVDFVRRTVAYTEYKKTKDVAHLQTAIHSAFLNLDESLKLQDEFVHKHDTSGCTAICAIITPSHVVVANAGDSRAVMYTTKGTHQLSRDHKPYLEDERKRIESAGGMVSMQRVDGDLALSRSLGDFQFKDRNLPPERQKVTAVPEVQVHVRDPEKDLCLLLACDGVWDVCESAEAGRIVFDILGDGEKRMALVAEELLDQCLLRYSKDNMSAVVVGFAKLWEEHGKEGEGVEGRRRRRLPAGEEEESNDGGKASERGKEEK
ncbi:protein phosphatase 1a isoform 2 [Nannochloropsis gaditana]|nr:protein phosphatase 1a isoform 2 [Nannochloropsis gaditana]